MDAPSTHARQPVSIVRDAAAAIPKIDPPVIALGAGVAIALVLLSAAFYMRRKPRRPQTPAPRRSELPTSARHLKIPAAERKAVESLARVAGVREPAVLVLSQHAFGQAAHAALRTAPGGEPGLHALAQTLGFQFDPVDRPSTRSVA